MTCEAETPALTEILKQLQNAENDMQQEKAIAEAELLRSDVRVHDWRAVRLAVTLVRSWDTRRAQAESALERCKQHVQKNE